MARANHPSANCSVDQVFVPVNLGAERWKPESPLSGCAANRQTQSSSQPINLNTWSVGSNILFVSLRICLSLLAQHPYDAALVSCACGTRLPQTAESLEGHQEVLVTLYVFTHVVIEGSDLAYTCTRLATLAPQLRQLLTSSLLGTPLKKSFLLRITQKTSFSLSLVDLSVYIE